MEIKPTRYELTFEPIENFKFKGNETIYATIKKETDKIIMNAKELEIKNVSIENNEKIIKAKYKLNTKNEELIINLDKKIKGDVKINIEFIGINNDKMYGFYRSSYKLKNKIEYLLTTQFEPTDARAAFPCFDKPDMKANFDIKMIIDKNLDAISNMPIKKIEYKNGKKIVSFMTTPKMSTYLVYLGIGKFSYYKDELDGIELRVVTTKGKEGYAKLPMEYAKKFLSFYNDYFGIKYPLPKLDLIAIPDFAAGAMENWGAITFRESRFLINEESPILAKTGAAEVIAHEIAHQWFGDLVTMKWWDYLWLNESFATFMSYKAVANTIKEFEMDKDFYVSVFSTALSYDQFKSTHAIETHVKDPKEINEIFDRISYEKGASILSMFEHFVGEDAFRKGINKYLNKFIYSNATTEDLLKAIQEESNKKEFVEFAKYWISKEGYPILLVNKEDNVFKIKQKRFLISGIEEGRWPLYIEYLSKIGRGNIFTKNENFEIKDSYLKLNANAHGFYRALYTKDNLSMLKDLILKNKINNIDAWNIEEDLFAEMKSGLIELSHYLEFTNDIESNVGYPANLSILSHLIYLYILSKSNYIRNRIEKIALSNIKRLGFEEKKIDTIGDIRIRNASINALAIIGNEFIKREIKKLLNEVEKNRRLIDSKSAIYIANAMFGSSKEFGLFLKKYRSSIDPTDKMYAIAALGNFTDEKLIKKALELSRSKEIKLQDSFFIPLYVGSNIIGKKYIWHFIKSHWKEIMKNSPEGAHFLSRYIEALALIDDEKELLDIKKFFSNKENMRKDIAREYKQLIDRIQANIRVKKAMEALKL